MTFRPASLLILILLASGCTSGAGNQSAATTGPPAVDEDSGALLAVIRDEELRPVQGALVGIPDLAIDAETGEDGQALLANVPPGSHDVFVSALGYQEASAKVEFVAGTTTERSFALLAIQVEQPRSERIPFTGRFECAFTFLDIQWRTCDDTGTVWPSSDNSERFNKPLGVRQIVAELRWQAASAGTGQNLDFSVMEGRPDRQGCQWYANDYGPSPVKLVVTVGETYVNAHSAAATGSCGDTVIDDKDKDLLVKIHSSPTYVADQATVGVTLGQKYDGYVTLFYDMDAPEGYTAFKDA